MRNLLAASEHTHSHGATIHRISEEEFWRNYFSHVFAVKRRFELGGGTVETPWTGGAPADEGASYDDILPATPASPSPLTKTVSYPEKFHLARKYAAEGPPLPNLSDADRILLDALQHQAVNGECTHPRPGMWDTVEDKAKYEAWKKLGTMSKAEAMHLYVCPRQPLDPAPPHHCDTGLPPGVQVNASLSVNQH